MYPVPLECPTCRSALEVRELGCPVCATLVRGHWRASPFARLSPDQQTFLRLFVRARGNLSDLERTLGVSYPTVRAKLDAVIAVLEEESPAEAIAPVTDRAALLEQIARGVLSVEEGMARLRAVPRTEEKA